jgi:hypothetical protein
MKTEVLPLVAAPDPPGESLQRLLDDFRAGHLERRVRQRIDRDDVILTVPKLPETDERAHKRLMRNLAAQQQAWCGLWIGARRQAGAHAE